MKIDFDKASLVSEYNGSGEDTKKVLRRLFGEDMFKSVTERVKTYEDACRELGRQPDSFDYLPEGCRRRVSAMLKLETIIEALNEGWVPPFDGMTWMYWPWFWLYNDEEAAEMSDEEKEKCSLRELEGGVLFGGSASCGASAGFAFASSSNVPSLTTAYFGSRLCLKTKELAAYCGRQFIDLWIDFRLS